MVASGPIDVLHVDDDADIAELTATYLHRKNERLTVQTATNASEGLTTVAENSFDCVVSDYEMPGQNGIEFLRAIRETDTELPFILYTGKGSEEVASEAIAAGVTDYLQKEGGSSQYEVLANRIRNAVEGQRATKRAEDTEEWASTLLEYSSDYVFVVDEAGEISYVSPSVTRVLGYDPEELTGTDAFDSVHPDDVEKTVETLAEVLDKPTEDLTVEFRAEHSDGSHRWLEVRGRNLADDPVIGGVLVNARDITERKEREKELRYIKEEYETVFETVQDAIFLFDVVRTESDLDFELRYINPAHEAISGFSVEDDRGKTPAELLGEEAGNEVSEHYRQCVQSKETVSYREELDMVAGRIQWDTKLGPVIEEEEEVTQIVGVSRRIGDSTAEIQIDLDHRDWC